MYQLLTTLVECMKPELVVHLISRLQECADGRGGSSSKGGRSEVLAFVECLAANQGHVILTRSVADAAAGCFSPPPPASDETCEGGGG